MTTNNIVKFADFPRRIDKAAAARVRAFAAGDNDTAHEAATDAIENFPATSIAGVRAKVDRLFSYIDGLEHGELTEEGWASVDRLRAGITEGLDRMAPRRAVG